MKTGYLRQDESSHWYTIPKELVADFDRLQDEINSLPEESDEWCDAIDEFCEKFGGYMTGGSVDHVEIIIPE